MDSELDARATSTADEQASSGALVGEEREASPASSSAGPAWSPSESSSPESYDAQPAVLRSGCPRPSSRSTTIERTRESITCGRGAGEGRCRCEGWRWLAGGGRTGKWAGRGWAEGGLAVGEHREAKGVHGHLNKKGGEVDVRGREGGAAANARPPSPRAGWPPARCNNNHYHHLLHHCHRHIVTNDNW